MLSIPYYSRPIRMLSIPYYSCALYSVLLHVLLHVLLGPCPSRGALVSGIVTLSQYLLMASNAMKFDVYPFVWMTFAGCYGNIMVAMTICRCP